MERAERRPQFLRHVSRLEAAGPLGDAAERRAARDVGGRDVREHAGEFRVTAFRRAPVELVGGRRKIREAEPGKVGLEDVRRRGGPGLPGRERRQVVRRRMGAIAYRRGDPVDRGEHCVLPLAKSGRDPAKARAFARLKNWLYVTRHLIHPSSGYAGPPRRHSPLATG